MPLFPKNAKVDHLGITVKPENWDAAVKAYTEILGFELKRTWTGEIAGKPARFCFLSSGVFDDFYIELISNPELEEGLCEICFRVSDIEAIYDELQEKGITLAAGGTRGALPQGKKWMNLGTKCKIAYLPADVFKGAYPPYGIELIEYVAPMKEVFKTELQPTIYGP